MPWAIRTLAPSGATSHSRATTKPKGASDDLIATLRGFKRQALHAEVLEFAHPASGEAIRCEAPLPADMQALLGVLREDTAAHRDAERARR